MRHSPKLTGLGSSGIGSDTIRPSGSTGDGLPPNPESKPFRDKITQSLAARAHLSASSRARGAPAETARTDLLGGTRSLGSRGSM